MALAGVKPGTVDSNRSKQPVQNQAVDGPLSVAGQPHKMAQDSRAFVQKPNGCSVSRSYISSELAKLDTQLDMLAQKRAFLQEKLDRARADYATTSSWGVVILSVGTSLANAGLSRNAIKRHEQSIAEIDREIQALQARKLSYIKLGC